MNNLTQKQKRLIRKQHRKRSVRQLAEELSVSRKDVQAYIESLPSRNIDPGREKWFRRIALSLPVLFFLFLELGLRLFNYGGNLDLFITAPGEYAEYWRCNPHVGRRFFFRQSTVPDPPNDYFLKEKPENGYRLFALGGSTTAGYPYGNNVMFPRILQIRLADAFPDHHIEVINTGMTAINSYTLYDFLDEILEQDPDALLIYAGHNEFYGALGAGSTESLGKIPGFVKFYLKLQRFKTFLLVRDVLGTLKNWLDRLLFEGSVRDPSATLMERMVAEQTIPYGSENYQLGKRQFESNLRDILRKARAAGVRVLVSELVSNVRDMKPFISVATDSLPPADEVYAQARQFEHQGAYERARQNYYWAKDLDALRFRATEEFNAIIHRVAGEFGAAVVPMKADFEAASEHGLIGDRLMLEHLHPNVDGYFLMADAFFDAMREHGFITESWDTTRIKPAAYFRQNWGFTVLDAAYADLRIRVLKGNWPFQPKAVPNRALADYRPATAAESLAVKIWMNEGLNLERAHVALAERYEQAGNLQAAYEEYRALIHATPLNVSPYLRAANCLIKMKRLAEALPLLENSLELEKNAFAYKWIGQIRLNNAEVEASIPYLEQAVKMQPGDPQLLYNLSGAYALDGQYEQARQVLDRLYEITPNFPGAEDLKRQLDRL